MAEQLHADIVPLPEVGARAPLPPPRRDGMPILGWVLAAVLLAAAAGGWWFSQRESAPVPASPATPPAPVTQAGPAMPAGATAPAAATPVAPLPEPQLVAGPLDAAGVAPALQALVGKLDVNRLLIGDDFVQRFVVTVDNLGREHAPSRLWPVSPTAGRFQVLERDGQIVADPDNAARYTPLVLLAEQIDAHAATALYARMLPLMQPAYEALGYPGQRFHTRVMTVIDQLLATPEAPALIPLTLVEVKGEVPSERPWLRYEFADPALEAASAGQKILLRVGAVNERRLKTVLRAWRAELLRLAPR